MDKEGYEWKELELGTRGVEMRAMIAMMVFGDDGYNGVARFSKRMGHFNIYRCIFIYVCIYL